jgi:hypothetical protein
VPQHIICNAEERQDVLVDQDITIPVPRQPIDVPIGTLRAIVREMGITVAELNAL